MWCPQSDQGKLGDAGLCTGCSSSVELMCLACGRPLLALTTLQLAFGSVTPCSDTPKHLAEKILTSCSPLEGERKRVTALFSNHANFTALGEHLGPEAMQTLLNRFSQLPLGECHRCEGKMGGFLGYGFRTFSGARFGVEERGSPEVLDALHIQRSVRG